MQTDHLPKHAISVKGLQKIYRDRKSKKEHLALDSIDLEIPRGCIFGLLGPNGAGKSTFINILAGLVIKTKGDVVVWDCNIDKEARNARAAIGIVPQELSMDPFLKPLPLLEIMSGLYGVSKKDFQVEKILEMIGLQDKAQSPMRSLSGGMMRRLLIGKAFVHNPPILVLDEPTAGVDVHLRRQLWQNIKTLNKKGVTILLTTHYLEEAEQLCDRIAIIDHGKLIINDETQSLLRLIDSKTVTVTCAKALKNIPAALKNYDTEFVSSTVLKINYRPKQTKISTLLQEIFATEIDIKDIETSKTDLETIFLQLTETE